VEEVEVVVVEVVEEEVGISLEINIHHVLHMGHIFQAKYIQCLVHKLQFFLALRMLLYRNSQRTIQ
jgi:hypothetical protein